MLRGAALIALVLGVGPPLALSQGARPSAPDATLRAPPDSAIPAGPLGAAIRRGRALLVHTTDSLPRYARSALRCMSCHLDDGRRANAFTLIGAYARFPQYRARSGRVDLIEDRINDCFERSLNGRRLPEASRDMKDMVAYLAWMSRGVAVGSGVPGQGVPSLAPLPGDTTRGARLFTANCVRCHGLRGEGSALATPLWGEKSFNIGAGMARQRTLAAFIHRNMPFDRPMTLTAQQAYDLAAYIGSRPRPDFPGKELDWPNGDPPPDVAYPTRASRLKAERAPTP